MKKKIIYQKKNKINDERVDIFLQKTLNYTRSYIKKMIDNGFIKINNQSVKKNGTILKNNDLIVIEEIKETQFILEPVDTKLDIKFENDFFIIANKPNGMLTHPSSFNETNTLANIIKNHWILAKNENFPLDDTRQGICNRLDKYTEGLLIIAKNLDVQKKLMELIKNDEIKREYTAILEGKLKAKIITVNCPINRTKSGGVKMEVSSNIRAKNAITHFSIIKRYSGLSLVKCILETGRTHQIRVHAKYIMCPVLNDPLYGNHHPKDNYQQYLVANRISFHDPLSNSFIDVNLDMPSQFTNYLKDIASET